MTTYKVCFSSSCSNF